MTGTSGLDNKRELDRLFGHLFEDSPTAYVIVDLTTGKVLVNREFRQMMEIDEETAGHLRPETVFGIYMDDEPPAPEDLVDVSLDSTELITTMCRSDGSRFPASVRLTALRDQRERPTHIVCAVRDTTTEYESRRELEESARQAREALSAKTRFVASVSHELRTPMHSILGLSELLTEAPLIDELSADARELARSINVETKSLNRVLDDILDLSRIEAGRLELLEESCDLAALVADTAEFLRPEAERKGLELRTVTEDLPPAVLVDPLRMRQILLNIVGNAVKFTDEGSVTISARASRRDPDHATVCFEVTDTGIGIDADALRDIFEPFGQASTATASRRGGTGLGLAIVHELVRLMGGDVRMSTQLGQGTTVSISMDAVVRPAPVEVETPPSPPHADASAPLEGTVAVVDDSEINRMVVERQLEKLGCSSVMLSSGGEVVQRFQDLDADLILMDWQMPDMDGLETTRSIRHIEEHTGGHVPIIAMTANAMAGTREACIESGMDDFLPKPVSLEALHLMLASWLSRERDAAPAVADPTPRGSAASGAGPVACSSGAVDRGDLVGLVDELGDRGIVARMIRSYLDELPGRLDVLSASTGERAERIAHTLKSTSEILGARRLARCCARLESHLHTAAGDLPALRIDVRDEAGTVAKEMEKTLQAWQAEDRRSGRDEAPRDEAPRDDRPAQASAIR